MGSTAIFMTYRFQGGERFQRCRLELQVLIPSHIHIYAI